MKLFHNHTWKIVSARDMTMSRYSLLTSQGVPYRDITEVVQQCTSCQKLRSTTLDGSHAANIMATINPRK